MFAASDVLKNNKNNAKNQQRSLSVHEYLAFDMLRDANVKVPKGGVAGTPKEAFEIAKSLGNA